MLTLYIAALWMTEPDVSIFAVYPTQAAANMALEICELTAFGKRALETRRRLRNEPHHNLSCVSRVVTVRGSGEQGRALRAKR